MSLPNRMAVVRRFGSPEVIEIESHEVPPLSPREVRVAVRTGGLNPVDARRRAGTFGGSVPMLLGTEFAGIVVESHDPKWHRGDAVIGWGANGADADLVSTDGSKLHAKPADLDWALAGGLSGIGQTALTALNALTLSAGDAIVVHGAAGGVGTMLTQLAVARGINVIGTASAANQDYLRELGATPVVYGAGAGKELGDRLALAAAGMGAGRTLAASVDLAGTPEAGDVARAVQAAGGQAITLVPETAMSHQIPLVRVQHSPEQMRELLAGIASGALRLPVEAIPFTQIAAAHRRLDAKHARGKIVLDLSDNPHLPASARTTQASGETS